MTQRPPGVVLQEGNEQEELVWPRLQSSLFPFVLPPLFPLSLSLSLSGEARAGTSTQPSGGSLFSPSKLAL